MDKKDVVREAKATIDNIKSAQTTLDNYLRRLENIVERLEFEDLKRERLTMSDVENIQEKLKISDVVFASDENLEPKTFKSNEESVHDDKVKDPIKFNMKKGKGFIVNFLIFLGIIFLSLSLFLTVKRVNPNYNFFNNYIYNYNDTNMEDDIKYNSLVIVSKLKREDLKVNDDIAYKQDHDQIKIVRVVELIDNKQNEFKTKSISHIFEDEDILKRSEVLGKVKYTTPILGGVFAVLVSNFWLVYLISGLLLLIAYLLNNREDKKILWVKDWIVHIVQALYQKVKLLIEVYLLHRL